MNRSRLVALTTTAALLSACASTVAVRPVASVPAKIDTVCIERNAEVLVDDLLPAIEAAFGRNGIATRIFDVSPAPCPYRDRELIGEANYALPSGIFGGGGISPDKWRGAAFKIDPMMDEMLARVKQPRS